MEFVGAGAASANTGNTAGRSISPAVPAGVQAGDVLVIYLVGANHTSVGVCEVNTPSGWTALLADETSPTASANYIFVKTAGGSESAPTISVGTSGGEKAQMAALRGVTLPVDDFQSDSTQSSASSSQIQWPSVTPTAGSSIVLAFGTTWVEWTSAAASSGFTLISQSTNVRSMIWQYKLHSGGTVPSDVFQTTGASMDSPLTKRGFAAVFPSANEAPTADAGEDLEVREGDEVQLDGTGSSDPDGDTLTYSWEVIDDDGTGLTTGDLTGANTATPTFIAPTPTNVVLDGAYATGGTVTEADGYRIHTFTSDGTLTVESAGEVEYIVVAGGGAGGGGGSGNGGSGGGGGGVVINTDTLSAGNYPVVIGAGGSGSTVPSTNGEDSSFNGETAVGGGHGGRTGVSAHGPGSGGSGGGATPDFAAGSGTPGQGNDGGPIGDGGTQAGGGGGGAGAPGGATGPNARDAGDGGDGIEWPTGSGNYYGGGGGGSNGNGGGGGFVSNGGLGGGGRGHSGTGTPDSGVPNTGGGGGASRAGTPGDGGSGVVVVRYPIPNELVRANIVLQLTVTDPSGATDTDTVTVTVIPAALIDFTGSGGVLVGGSALAEYVTPDTVAGSGGVLVGGTATIEDLTFEVLADVTMSGGIKLGGHADASKLSFEVHEPVPPAVLLPTYEAVLVARVPALSGVPELVVVDRLVVAGLSYTHELNRPGQANLGLPIRSLSSAVKERLANLARFPSEVWIYRDDHLDWAGEIQTLQVQGQTLTINCTGLLGYMFRMGVTEDLVFNDEDQFTIAKALVDHWQELPQGHYGIDTSDIETSGVTRDRTYLRDELHNIGERLQELAEVENGFDLHVDPATRKLVLSYPQRGRDLTASVFFDERNIDSAAVALSVSPDDLVTDVSATGTRQQEDGENTVTYAARENLTLRGWYGRSWAGVNFSNVSQAETVTAHADAYLAARDGVFFQPGVTIMPRPGADVGDFEPGDTVSYSYDAGLGLMSGEYRVAKVTVTVNEGGEQRIGVEFV